MRPNISDLSTLAPYSGGAEENLTVGTTVAATADIGGGTDGTVTITVDTAGAGGNDYTVEVELGSGLSQPLAAAINGTAITVTLATDGSGDPDDAANTATLIAAAIDALTGVSAAASGTGGDPIDTAEGPTSFTGGISSYSLTGPFTGDLVNVLVTVGTQPVRVTFDGSEPTSTNGHYWVAATERILSRKLATQAKFIRQGGTNSDIHATALGAG